MSDRVNKAIKGCKPDTFELRDLAVDSPIESLDHYVLTAFDTETGRKFLKRLPGPITTCLAGTDGRHIDIKRSALLDLLYCPQTECGMSLDGCQVMVIDVYHDSMLVTFEYRG